MSELHLSGATIDATNQKVKEGSSAYSCVIACGWSDEFCERFAVQTPSEPYGKSPISRVSLSGVNFILTPHEQELKSFEIDVECNAVHKFQYVPRFDKNGKVKSRELHFTVSLKSLEGMSKVAMYADRIGQHGAAIKIVYNENTQTELELEDGEEGGGTVGDPREQPTRGRRKARK